MGNGNSIEINKGTNDLKKASCIQSTTDEFFLNIRAPNFIHVVDAPREILQQLINCLGSSAKSVRPVWRAYTYEIELLGSPFFEDSSTCEESDGVLEIAFCRFLPWLQKQNWHAYASLNLSPFCDRSTCYFRKNQSQILSDEEDTVSISFRTQCTLLVTSNAAPCLDTVCNLVQPSLCTTFQSCRLNWNGSIAQSSMDYSRTLTVPINLWKCTSLPDSVLNRRFLLEIISQLENSGYRLSACIDFRGKSDTLFFTRKVVQNNAGTYCLLSAHQWNLLRLFEAPQDLIDVTKLLIAQHWPSGLEKEYAHGNWHEFHLTDCPWAARAADAAQSRSMFAYLLQTYLARGWRPVASVQLSRRFKDRSCVVLRKENPAYRPHMCLGLLDANELNLINAEDDLRDYVIGFACSGDILRKKLPKASSKGGWPVISLRGTPWCNESLANRRTENGKGHGKVTEYDWLQARAFVQNLLVALRFRGWEPVLQVDLAARVRYKRRSSSTACSSSKGGNTCGKFSRAETAFAEESIPLDVNSLILANVNGSRHNSFARPTYDSARFVLKAQMSADY